MAEPSTIWSIPLDSLTETRERPLFVPSRRPPAAAASASREEGAPATLLGVVEAADGSGLAVIQGDGGAPVRVMRTQAYRGWRLAEVRARQAVFERDGRVVLLTLQRPGGTDASKASSEPALAPSAVNDVPLIPAPLPGFN
jgi:general secretion pathway protein N